MDGDLTLDRLCTRAGLILHRTAREVARTCSLRAIHLLLAEQARAEAAATALHARAMHLASAAKWDKSAGRNFTAFLRSLDAIATPRPPRRATRSDLVRFFTALCGPAAS